MPRSHTNCDTATAAMLRAWSAPVRSLISRYVRGGYSTWKSR